MQDSRDPGLWVDGRAAFATAGRAALFLDRDGVVVAEVDYLGRADDVRMLPGVAAAIAAANRQGVPVILVTNQSGIARGYFGWTDFAAVQARVAAMLQAENAWLDLVLACAHHASGQPGVDIADHPWRKPNPGMLLHAHALFGIDLRASHIVGDRLSDLEAGARAGLPGGTLVRTGYGAAEAARLEERKAALADNGFRCSVARDAAEAITAWLAGS